MAAKGKESPQNQEWAQTPPRYSSYLDRIRFLLVQRSEYQVFLGSLSEYLMLMLTEVPGESDFAVLNYMKLHSTDTCKEVVCFECAAYWFESA